MFYNKGLHSAVSPPVRPELQRGARARPPKFAATPQRFPETHAPHGTLRCG